MHDDRDKVLALDADGFPMAIVAAGYAARSVKRQESSRQESGAIALRPDAGRLLPTVELTATQRRRRHLAKAKR